MQTTTDIYIYYIFFSNKELGKYIRNNSNNENWPTAKKYVDTIKSYLQKIKEQEKITDSPDPNTDKSYHSVYIQEHKNDTIVFWWKVPCQEFRQILNYLFYFNGEWKEPISWRILDPKGMVEVTAVTSQFYQHYWYLLNSEANGVLEHSPLIKEEVCECPDYDDVPVFGDFTSNYKLNLKLFRTKPNFAQSITNYSEDNPWIPTLQLEQYEPFVSSEDIALMFSQQQENKISVIALGDRYNPYTNAVGSLYCHGSNDSINTWLNKQNENLYDWLDKNFLLKKETEEILRKHIKATLYWRDKHIWQGNYWLLHNNFFIKESVNASGNSISICGNGMLITKVTENITDTITFNTIADTSQLDQKVIEVEEKQNRLKNLKKEKRKQLEDLEEQYAAQLEGIDNQHDQELYNLEDRHEEQLDECKRKYRINVESIKENEDKSALLAVMKEEYEADKQKATKDFKRKKDELNKRTKSKQFYTNLQKKKIENEIKELELQEDEVKMEGIEYFKSALSSNDVVTHSPDIYDKEQFNWQTERSLVSEAKQLNKGIKEITVETIRNWQFSGGKDNRFWKIGSGFLKPNLSNVDHTITKYTLDAFIHQNWFVENNQPLKIRIEFSQKLLNWFKNKKELVGKTGADWFNAPLSKILSVAGYLQANILSCNFPFADWFRAKIRAGVYLWDKDHKEFYEHKLSDPLSIASTGDIRHNIFSAIDMIGQQFTGSVTNNDNKEKGLCISKNDVKLMIGDELEGANNFLNDIIKECKRQKECILLDDKEKWVFKPHQNWEVEYTIPSSYLIETKSGKSCKINLITGKEANKEQVKTISTDKLIINMTSAGDKSKLTIRAKGELDFGEIKQFEQFIKPIPGSNIANNWTNDFTINLQEDILKSVVKKPNINNSEDASLKYSKAPSPQRVQDPMDLDEPTSEYLNSVNTNTTVNGAETNESSCIGENIRKENDVMEIDNDYTDNAENEFNDTN